MKFVLGFEMTLSRLCTALAFLLPAASGSAFAINRPSAVSASKSIPMMVKTIESEVLKNLPARQKNENDPEPIKAMDALAFPTMEALSKKIENNKSFDRETALFLMRAVEDLSKIDPSESAAMMVGDSRHVPSMKSLMGECRQTKNSTKAELATPIKNQSAVTAAGLNPITMAELCEYSQLMKDLERLEREGNG